MTERASDKPGILPDECEVSIEHALEHLRSAWDSSDDPGQVVHDVDIAIMILRRLEDPQPIADDLAAALRNVYENAEVHADPRMADATDCCLVPLSDIANAHTALAKYEEAKS